MPLCPELYKLLQLHFGDVKISHEDETFEATYVRKAERRFPSICIKKRGETYRVCCPLCGDTRFRLWINHRWGQKDPISGCSLFLLIRCFNENCFRELAARQWIQQKVFGGANFSRPMQLRKPSRVHTPTVPVLPSSTITNLSDLPADHHAVTYIKTRGLDPAELSRPLNISYCEQANAEFYQASNRIIIPIYMDGQLKGWQARYIGDKDWKTTGILKYYSMPGMERHKLLYNYDIAKNFPYVIVVEGPTDCWAVGRPSVATFGKCISHQQLQLLVKIWGKGTILLCLDRDANDETEKAMAALRSYGAGSVLSASLPGKDPGELPRWRIWEFLAQYLPSTRSQTTV